jgi:hypothetical protein
MNRKSFGTRTSPKAVVEGEIAEESGPNEIEPEEIEENEALEGEAA